MSAARIDEEAKRLATSKARAALIGATLIEIEGDDGRPLFVLTRWSLTKSFDDLADVERVLKRMAGGPAA